MAIDIKTIWDSAKTTLMQTESFDLANHLKEPYLSSTRARLPAHLRIIQLIFENYEQMISDFQNIKVQDEIVGLRLMILKKALNGDNGNNGFKKGLGIFFNHGEFQREVLNRKMIAQFIYLCISKMAENVSTCNADTSCWNEDARKYFDLEYIKSELMEVPNKYR